MRFSTFVVKNIVRRRVRSSLTIIGVAVAVGAVVALVGISFGFERSFIAIYQHQKVDLIIQQAGVKQKLTSTLPESLGPKIAAVPGVASVNSGLVDWLAMEELGPVGVLVQGWQPDSLLFDGLTIISGEKLGAGDKKKIMLGKRLAASLDKQTGDKLNILENQEYEVVGVFEGSSVYESGSMLMLLSELQDFMGRKNQVSGFTVTVADRSPESIERVRKAIAGLAKNLEVTPTAEFVNSTSEIRFIRAMAWITSTVALFIGAIGMLNTMIMSVFERTKEIGVLRAIGWGRWRVVKMILMESIILSLIGGVVGTVAAVLLTRVLSSMPAVAGVIDTSVAPSVIIEGFMIALGVGLLGAIYPAYRGAQLMPTEALRHE
ncbi:MAG: ABC transporter permease [Thermoguttaceae bacterium]